MESTEVSKYVPPHEAGGASRGTHLLDDLFGKLVGLPLETEAGDSDVEVASLVRVLHTLAGLCDVYTESLAELISDGQTESVQRRTGGVSALYFGQLWQL